MPYFCRINSGQIFYMSRSFFGPHHYVHEKLQRNPSVGSCLKIFTSRPYGFDYLWFFTNAHRGGMRSKTQWVFYRDLDCWPGPQKVQFGKIAGYPELVGLILALLMLCWMCWRVWLTLPKLTSSTTPGNVKFPTSSKWRPQLISYW